MSREEIVEQLNRLSPVKTEEDWTQSHDIIEKRLQEDIHEEERKDLEHRLSLLKASKIQMNLHKDLSLKEEAYYRGKLIGIYQEALERGEDDSYFQLINEEFDKQKETIQKIKDSGSKLPIKPTLGFFIQDIADTIQVFEKEKDIEKKAKNTSKEILEGANSTFALVGGVGIALQTFVGIPLTLSSIVGMSPVLSYVCLPNILRNLTGKAKYQKDLFHQSDDYKTLVNSFTDAHKEELQEIDQLAKTKIGKSLEEKILVNEKLIDKLDAMVLSTDLAGIKQVFQLQALRCYRENKDYCEELKEEFLKEGNNQKEYVNNNQKLSTINLEIFQRDSSLEKAIQNANKNVINNLKVMLLAKALLSCVAPETFKIDDSMLEPLAFAIMKGIIDKDTYQNKLHFRETEYEGIVQVKNSNRIREVLEQKNNA